MFRKIDTKKLVFLFLILAILALIVFLRDRNQSDRTFKSELFSVDSASVTAIKIFPKGKNSDPLILEKTGKNWDIKINNKKYPADSAAVNNILTALAQVTAERVAASDRAAWKDLEITDSLGRRVVVEQGKTIAADFMVGKVSVSQRPAMQGMVRNQGFSVKSHIRIAGDDHVYVVDGFLSMIFSDQPAQYRNRLICRFNPKEVTKLTFVYPGDSSFILSRSGNNWLVNGEKADSAKTVIYINSIANSTGAEFADDGDIPVTYPYSLRIEGTNMSPIEVTGATGPLNKMYYIRSSTNTSAIFGSGNATLFNQIFASKSKF
ncbi:MAG: DUF4340 domain-containing protein [Bacteroidales bacterium]|nr:DUF4340 domain-containing protein [Bacteroidales bacterium]